MCLFIMDKDLQTLLQTMQIVSPNINVCPVDIFSETSCDLSIQISQTLHL